MKCRVSSKPEHNRLGEDVAQLRAQLAEGLGEARSRWYLTEVCLKGTCVTVWVSACR